MSATEAPAPDPGASLDVVVIGAGPAGLTAAHELTGRGVPVTVLEAGSAPSGEPGGHATGTGRSAPIRPRTGHAA